MVPSIGTPSGHSATTCGYCSPAGTRSAARSSIHTAGLSAHQLSCQVYQMMIDRGWRRSGTWCYKPDLKRSCCPQYTIKLDAAAFQTSKSQRKLIHRFNRAMLYGRKSEDRKLLSKHNESFSLTTAIHGAETSFLDSKQKSAHRFETILEPSSYSLEKFELYTKYQKEIHKDVETKPGQFKGFLVDSPLTTDPIPYSSAPPAHLPQNYGSYHQLYKCDEQLFALGVIDILPYCVSSVYFIYDPDWAEYSLGKLSALREVSLALEMQQAGAPDMTSLYMGFYIHSCPKMRYKGEYSPSYLADPETYEWTPLETCMPLLEKHRYACFSNPDHSIAGAGSLEYTEPPKPKDQVLEQVLVVSGIKDRQITVVPVKRSRYWNIPEMRKEILDCIWGLGEALGAEVIFYFQL
ncbi:arginine-tRNA-protein transferase [Roridomyces roridus]|uniref:arginyltransferase n=1 Tax=Roridomyces roridus TaxID=1738132 RepID=A0AAD7FRG3_9AGAR|nr:arginine-tRNA-protein transferase [Roridomyces roridus]